MKSAISFDVVHAEDVLIYKRCSGNHERDVSQPLACMVRVRGIIPEASPCLLRLATSLMEASSSCVMIEDIQGWDVNS